MADAPTIVVDATTRIRPWRQDDAQALWEAVDGSREHIAAWLPWADRYVSPVAAHEFIRSAIQGYREGRFDLAVEVGGAVAGGCRFGPVKPVRRVEVGYWLALPYTKRGIMTRCVAALCQTLVRERDVQRIQIMALGDNAASRAIPERLGFRLEGIFREARMHRGEWRDEASYATTAGEWQATHPGTSALRRSL
jgi:ribosomal-protein-serine acetyltransferase